MREIKFRIYANNRFYYKCLVGNTNNTNDNSWTCPLVWIEDKNEWVHCDNGIISQYTGLKDKNGVEIYEGDIVKITRENQNKYLRANFKATIEWSDEYLAYILNTEQINEAFEDLGDYLDDYELKVIGNIYDNLELLER